MSKIVNVVLVDLDGQVIKVQTNTHPMAPAPGEDAPDLTVARVLVNAALTPAQGQPHNAEATAGRYALAVDLYKAEVGAEIEVPVDLIPGLRADVLRLYAPLVGGQMLKVLG